MELDDAYANAAYIPGAEAMPAAWAARAAAFREGMIEQGLAELDVSYGETARQRFDLFYPGETPKGVLVFVHGGYWLRFDKSYWSHLAGGALANGWAVAMPSYDLCPEVSIAQITKQITNAVRTIAGMVAGPISLAGHSAGGHLVARMLEHGRFNPDISSRFQSVMPISPVADLRPLLRTSMNEAFKLDEAGAIAESPTFMRHRVAVPVTVWVGGAERPAFLEQAEGLAAAWGCARVVVPDEHHFNVIDPLSDPKSDMVSRLIS